MKFTDEKGKAIGCYRSFCKEYGLFTFRMFGNSVKMEPISVTLKFLAYLRLGCSEIR